MSDQFDHVARDISEAVKSSTSSSPSDLGEFSRLLYQEMRRVARSTSFGRPQDRTIGTTALVNECYIRIAETYKKDFADRRHFLAIATKVMRNILCDYARQRLAQKRGGGNVSEELFEGSAHSADQAEQLVFIDQLLSRLHSTNPRAASVFECRYFGGLNDEETAETLQLSLRTVQREWASSKDWVRRQFAK